jgi:hypothetical protein
MNYNSVEEILNAGTTNMTILRNNVKQDDGTDSITGATWLTYNGSVVNTIYASGNSFLGFGSSTEHLKVNRRDGAMWYLYREEGTLYNYYKFIKIRWEGYTAYNQTSSSYKLIYDVILWDTGDISLHMVNMPTMYANGTYSLVTSQNTYTYTISSSSPDVTFVKTDSGYIVNKSIIYIQLPCEKRYLIRSDSIYYTMIDNKLSTIEVDSLTSNVFLNYGTEIIPPYSLLSELSSPEILYWVDKDAGIPEVGLIVNGEPQLPRVLYYENKIIPEGQRINSVKLVSRSAIFAVSCDDGQTWKYHDGNNWIITEDVNVGTDGQSFNDLTSKQWQDLGESPMLKIRVALTSASDSYVSDIYFDLIEI